MAENGKPLQWKVPRPAGRKPTVDRSSLAEAVMALRHRRPGQPGAPSRPEKVKTLPGLPIEPTEGQMTLDDALDDPEFK